MPFNIGEHPDIEYTMRTGENFPPYRKHTRCDCCNAPIYNEDYYYLFEDEKYCYECREEILKQLEKIYTIYE